MTKWEHKSIGGLRSHVWEEIQRYGLDGWQLCGYAVKDVGDDQDWCEVVMKREIGEPSFQIWTGAVVGSLVESQTGGDDEKRG